MTHVRNAKVNGVKGRSPLLDIAEFDFIKAFVPDYLHGVCLGKFKYFMNLFSDNAKENFTKPWCIAKKLKRVKNRIQKIMPPSEISRTPQTFDRLSNMKASEFRSFGIYYHPVMEGILPEPYFTHFCFLSHAIYSLLQDKISIEKVRQTAEILDFVVLQTEILYGKEHVSYNVHLLTHLCQWVLYWGCIWGWSTFIPKWVNGQLNGLGTQSQVEQMGKNFLMRNCVRDEIISLIKNPQIHVPKETIAMFRKMQVLPASVFKYESTVRHDLKVNNAHLLGKPTSRKLTIDEEVIAINLILGSSELSRKFPQVVEKDAVPTTNAKFFSILQINSGAQFTTSSCTRSTKRIDFCCLLSHSNFFFIENIILLEELDNFAFITGFQMGIGNKTNFVPDRIVSDSSTILCR